MPAHDPVPNPAEAPIRRTLRQRVAFLLFRLTERMKLGAAGAYLAAASLVGFETLVTLLSLSSIWPMSLPFVIGALALVYLCRERIRAWWRRRCSRD